MAQLIDPSTETFTASPFADAVLTPSHAVSSTGPAGDRAAPREGIDLNLVDRPRPVVEIGRRMPLLAGRGAELDDLSNGIRSGESFEVFAGEGFGKTSLVNMLLHDKPDLKGYFADGEVLLSGRSVAPGDLVGALFRAFFSAEQAIALDEGEMLRRLSPVKALIVLDGVDVDDDELQEIIAALASPVFIVTSPKRRLHDFMSRAIGPLQDEDLVAVAALRLGFELNETDRQLVVQLAHLVDDSPRAWARALELVENREDLTAMVARLDGAREPRAETARLALDQTSPAALNVVTLISELNGTGVSEEMLEEVLDIGDSSALTVEIESQGLGLMQDGLLTVSDDIADLASDHMDGERVMGAAFDRLVVWSQTAEPEQLVEEVASITAFADWALEHDRAEDVVELGRRVDGPLFQKGRWGAAAALLLLVRRAGEAAERPADTAWAMHQMGVRELALGDAAAAKPHLREARSIRRRIGDKAGAALSHEHLKLLGPMAALAAPLVAKFVIGLFLTAGVATGGAVVIDNLNDGPDDIVIVTQGDPAPLPTPELAVELDGPTSVRVSFSLAEELQQGEIVQVTRVSPDATEEMILETVVKREITDRGLVENSEYGYKARVVNDQADPNPWSEVLSVSTLLRPVEDEDPAAPTGLIGRYDDTGDGRVILEWDRSTEDDLAGYDVRRDGIIVTQLEALAEYVDSAPIAGATHFYQVLAIDEGGNQSGVSAPAEVSIPGPPPPIPPSPTNLLGSYTPDGGVTLTWSGTTSSYLVDRDGWDRSRVVTHGRFVDVDVAPNRTYNYSVYARLAGVSSNAATEPVTTTYVPPDDPTPPVQTSAGIVGDVVRIEWSPPSNYDFTVSYEVLRNGAVLATGVSDTTYDDPLPPDDNYSYTILAINSVGVKSDPSEAAKITLPIGPETAIVKVIVVGSGEVSGDISCSDTCQESVEVDTEVSLTATEDSGSTFVGWDGDGCSGTSDTCTFTVGADTEVRVTFSTVGEKNLTIGIDGDGSGSVASSPTGISCPAGSCTEGFEEASTVVLTAEVGELTDFGGWSGCAGTGLTCTVSMDSDLTIVATFDAVPPLTLTAYVDGSGTGRITSSPLGIDCPSASCSALFPQGSVVLTATPTGGSSFTGWSSGLGCDDTSTQCIVPFTSDTTVTAYFDATPPLDWTLGVDVVGLGSVSSTPSGIDNCSTSCAEDFENGAPVTLAATADGGWYFVGWSGGGCPPSGDCTVTLTSDMNVQAFFEEAAVFTETLVVADAGDTFIQMRFTSSLDASWEATIAEDGGSYSDSASGTATGLVAETVRFEGLQVGTDYTIAVTLDGGTSDEEFVQTNGGTTPIVPVAISNVVVQAFTDQIHITYETNVVANGSYKVFESGVLVQANTGQGSSAQTSHQAKPGVFCCAVNPYPLLLTPGTTYTIEITAEAGGAGQGGGNTATITRVVDTLP